MKSDRHYWKTTFSVLTAHISGVQKIRVQKRRMSEWLDVVFEGTLLDLDKRENRHLKNALEYELFNEVKAEGDTLIIGIDA